MDPGLDIKFEFFGNAREVGEDTNDNVIDVGVVEKDVVEDCKEVVDILFKCGVSQGVQSSWICSQSCGVKNLSALSASMESVVKWCPDPILCFSIFSYSF